jgi:hypothetical protein
LDNEFGLVKTMPARFTEGYIRILNVVWSDKFDRERGGRIRIKILAFESFIPSLKKRN